MANIKTVIEHWSVKDLEDNSAIGVVVESCTELGNGAQPGVQVSCLGRTINYEPGIVEQWAYRAKKEGVETYFLENESWVFYDDQYVKNYLLLGKPLKARIVVKTRSSEPVVKEYELPFII